MSETPTRVPHPQQKLLLGVAGGLLAVALVLVLVVVLRGSDGPPAGSPEALTDQVAAALTAHDPARVAAVTCRSARSTVARATRPWLSTIGSAHRSGSANVLTDLALNRISVTRTGGGGDAVVTVSMRRVHNAWCVAGVAMAAPSHG